MNDCIFCKIVRKEIPSTLVHEGTHAIAFRDIRPKAKHHILIVPKKHIDSLMTMEESDHMLVGHLIWDAKKIAEQLGLEGYQLRCHVGAKGGQEVFHIHFHLLAD